jgi:hypothetical protein
MVQAEHVLKLKTQLLVVFGFGLGIIDKNKREANTMIGSLERRGLTYRYSLAITRMMLLLLVALVVLRTGASARPYRGQIGLSVLLCTFTDSPAPPHDADFYRHMILGQGNGSLADYWRATAYGGVDFATAVVSGWHQESLTTAQAQAKSGGPNPRRGELVDDCITATHDDPAAPYTVPPGHIVAVITSPGVDMYGGGGRAFLPDNVDIGGLGHEVGHGLGLNHSFSDDPTYRNADWAAIGEYDDPWDVMSYGNVFARWNPEFGGGGPGLNAHHVDRMGWLPRQRIVTFGADGLSDAVLTLAALNHPEADGALLVRVPFDPGDPFHYFTIEFRKHDGWDAGIPDDIVLIHEVKSSSNGQYLSYLLRERGGSRAPVQSVNREGVTIQVNPRSSAVGPNQALVTIHSEYADRCLMGYVWREAVLGDKVCVSGVTREQAHADNAQATARRDPNGGSFGPDTCIQGYVWREATPNDHVCVTPKVRQQTRQDNAEAPQRHNPARFVYGPNTCKQGYVWREADASDWVCVTPDVRTQTRQDNAAAASRRDPNGGPFGPDTCLQGYVWREAFPGDHVCVVGATRAQAAADNREAPNRLMVP